MRVLRVLEDFIKTFTAMCLEEGALGDCKQGRVSVGVDNAESVGVWVHDFPEGSGEEVGRVLWVTLLQEDECIGKGVDGTGCTIKANASRIDLCVLERGGHGRCRVWEVWAVEKRVFFAVVSRVERLGVEGGFEEGDSTELIPVRSGEVHADLFEVRCKDGDERGSRQAAENVVNET